MPHPNWQGVYSVMVTPFAASGTIGFVRFQDLIEQNIRNGADGVIVCGSTGEFYAMTVEERDLLFRATVEAVAGRVPVIAGVSHLRTDVVLDLCRRAEGAARSGLPPLPPVSA